MYYTHATSYEGMAQLLRNIRSYLFDQSFLEVESSLLLPHPNVEAFIDSMRVTTPRSSLIPSTLPSGCNSDPPARFLISSPELAMKEILLRLRPMTYAGIFQIAHCFRSTETGSLHTDEFLMLECYLLDSNMYKFMDFFANMFKAICSNFLGSQPWYEHEQIARRTLAQVFRQYTGRSWQELRQQASDYLQFEEVFQKHMIEDIEQNLGQPTPEFVYYFPAEMASFSKVTSSLDHWKSYAHRFELYWQGIELANGYWELTTYQEYAERLRFENQLRRSLGKQEITLPIPLLLQLQKHGPLPPCSGIAMGLDRLLMLLLGYQSFSQL